MPNPVLTRLLTQRDEQVQFINKLLEQVETEGRDLVDAERSNLEASKQRIAELDEQIKPLEDFDKVAAAHRAAKPAAPSTDVEDRAAGGGERLGVRDRQTVYRTAGEFVVDKIRALGYPGEQVAPDVDALQRVQSAMQSRAIQNQTTAETPGLLPEPIIGTINTELDGSRPFVSSIGVKPLAGIPGKTFSRPHVTQHTLTGPQSAEKGELPSRQFKVEGIPFTKGTYGGALNVSRQEIDWTSPAAWDALITDLQLEYGADTEDAAAAAFGTAVTQTVERSADTIAGWVAALYDAAVIACTANNTRRATALRLPNHIWVSLDMWAAIGTIVDAARATNASNLNPGTGSPTDLQAGDILSVARTMAPGLPTGTVIVGRTDLTEFYEERIGLLQAVEPKILGVEVAYGGYAAFGQLDPTAFCKVTAPAAG